MAEKNKSQLKLLLLQIRESPIVQKEELESFTRYCRLQPGQIDVHNVFDHPFFQPDIASGYDALLIGGASDANVLFPDKYPFVESAQALILQCIIDRLPVFASCFGYQLAVLALGGEIIHDDQQYEMGTIPIALTSEARMDPLMASTPDGFMAVSVHKQKAIQPPPGTTPLACTPICNHAFKVIDAPFWAFQFHPEVDRQIFIERLSFYKAHYTDGDDHLESVLATAQETPDSNALCHHFIQFLLGDR